MKSNLYKARENTGGLSKLASQSFPVASIVNAVPYQGELKRLTKKEVQDLCEPSIFNTRSYENLTMASVVDIFDDIRETKGNETLAKGVWKDGKIHVLVGLRRMFCVLNLNDALYNIVVVKDMHKDDQRHLARAEDTYNKPGILDLGFKVRKIRDDSKATSGKAMSYSDIASELGFSKGKVVEAANFTKIPDWIINKFPGFRYISYKWLRQVAKYEEYFNVAKPKLAKLDLPEKTTFDSVDAAQAHANFIATKIKAVLLAAEKDGHENVVATTSSFIDRPIAGVNVTGNDKQVVVKIDIEKVDKAKLQAIQKLLST